MGSNWATESIWRAYLAQETETTKFGPEETLTASTLHGVGTEYTAVIVSGLVPPEISA